MSNGEPSPIQGQDGARTGPAPVFDIPACYVHGYEAARARDPEMAERYIRYTTLADPQADQAVEQLANVVAPQHIHATIAKTVDRYYDPPKDTPEALRELIASSAVLPDWFDPKIALKATRAFLRNSDMVLGGLVGGAIVEGFSTLISKSFRIRSRIILNGVRRLKQNTLQLTEQFMPGGQEPGGDAWKLSLRIRLVHAQSRMLLRESTEWDTATHGMPLSTAHMLLGAAAFSGRLMHHVGRLGGDFTDEEREAYPRVETYGPGHGHTRVDHVPRPGVGAPDLQDRRDMRAAAGRRCDHHGQQHHQQRADPAGVHRNAGTPQNGGVHLPGIPGTDRR